MIRRDQLGVRVLECDRCGESMHLSPNGDAFDIGREVTADGWTFGLVDACRDCTTATAQQPTVRARARRAA